MIKNCGCLPNEVRFKKEIICHCIIPSMQTFFFVHNTLHIIWKVFILCRHSSKTIWKHSKHIFQHLFHWWIIHITYPGMKETTQHCKILHHNESWQWSSIEFPHVYTEECTLLVPPIPQTSLNLDMDANMESIVLDGGNRQWGGSEMLGEFDVFMIEYLHKAQPIPPSIINFYHWRPVDFNGMNMSSTAPGWNTPSAKPTIRNSIPHNVGEYDKKIHPFLWSPTPRVLTDTTDIENMGPPVIEFGCQHASKTSKHSVTVKALKIL